MSAGFRRFRAKPVVVHARQVTDRTQVQVAGGAIYARPGDWIILDGFGGAAVLPNAVFAQLYTFEPAAPQEDPTGTGKRRRFE